VCPDKRRMAVLPSPPSHIWGKEGLTPYTSLTENMKKLSIVIILTYGLKKGYDPGHKIQNIIGH